MDISELKGKVAQFVERNYVMAYFQKVEEKPSKKIDAKCEGLTEFVKKQYRDIGGRILRFIGNRGENYLDVYKAAEISPQLWYKYMTGGSKPGKDNMLRMAVVMDLDLDEAIQFLNLAGFGLSRCSKRDLVLVYFFKYGISNYRDINSCLAEIGLEPLFSE